MPAEEFWKQADAGQVPTAAMGQVSAEELSALPAVEQAEWIAEELKRLNPDFDTASLLYESDQGQLGSLTFLSTGATNLSPVRLLASLEKLSCSGRGFQQSPLSDLTPLRGLSLKELHCGNTRVRDLAPLAGMPLRVLNCAITPITDLMPPKGMPLQVLFIGRTHVGDLTPWAGMPLQEIGWRRPHW